MSSAASAVRVFNPEDHPPLAPSYSHISIVHISETANLISFAGQTGTSTNYAPDNPPSFPDQVRQALANVDKCLAAAGCTKADIVSNRQYVVKLTSLSREDQKARGEIYLEWWRKDGNMKLPPPDTLIGVDSLYAPGVLFETEITCVASV